MSRAPLSNGQNGAMGSRAENRERMRADIKQLGRAQLASVGAAALSLRAIARELGVVSSAVYRYFPSRDLLITELIVDAYNNLGATAERSSRRDQARGPRQRFLSIARAVRKWALANPNEWALVFGSPIPGYSAPMETIQPATRVPRLLVEILRSLPSGHTGGHQLGAAAAQAVQPLKSALAPDIQDNLIALGYFAWASIIGAVSLEAFGHNANVIDGSVKLREAYFDSTIAVLCEDLGIN